VIEWSHLDTSFGALIRSGVGILSVVLGSFVLAAKPRLRPNMLLGVFLVLDGLTYAIYALAGGFSDFPHKELVVPSHVVTTVVQFTLAGLLLAYAVSLLRRAGASGPTWAFAITVFLLWATGNPVVFFLFDMRPPVELFGSPEGQVAGMWDYTSFGFYMGGVAFACVALLASLRHDPDHPAARARLLLAGNWLAAMLTAMVVVVLAAASDPSFAGPFARILAVVGAALVLGVALGLLRLPRVGPWKGWWPVSVLLAGLAVAVVEMLLVAGDAPSDGGFGGVVALIGVAGVAYAVFRLDLLGVPVPRPRAGVLASIALATLFITAQVAQNFLSDELGLLTGGIVAGAAVFAAYPLQKAAEKAMEKRASGPDGRRPSTGEAAYRTALGLALRDRRLSSEEELELARLADQLGVGAVRALEIRGEVAGRRTRGA
jgi:hypothetical protein